jgi:RNA polymerase sigma-70 factor (ECF subfamily)
MMDLAMSKDALAIRRVLGARAPREAPPAMMDEAAFQDFYRRTSGPLRGYVTRVLGHTGPADDLVQEAYLRVLRGGPATEDPSELRAFLFRVAGNLIVDHWRRRARERGVPDARAAEATTPATDVPLRLDFARVFAELGPQERQMLWLAYVEGSAHQEIASALGLRTGSIRVLLHRARRKLARLVEARGVSRHERSRGER